MVAQRSGIWSIACVLILCGLWGCGGTSSVATAQDKTGKDKAPGDKAPANRLAKETSPYLLLHAHNPVDWFPWGPEAFAKAKKEKKLIFLSIGYSSCYWCHVMERLVFTNPEIAQYMNEHFVNIKVDREERPDVDEIYMTALQVYFQAIGAPQAGGWPLSMFLTPDLKPLGGGTYFPPEDKEGRQGFPSILKRIQTAWIDTPDEMQQSADALAKAVQQTVRARPVLVPVKLEASLVATAVEELKATFDSEHGGFDFNPKQPTRPKFPVPVKLSLLQKFLEQHPQDDGSEMLYFTLDQMAAGGIHDQLGGGFHRYSTDRFWRVPHFEKMLYDNAQLADVYVAAYKASSNQLYRTVAEDIFTFVLRDLTDDQGAFYSALDAETDGIEGQYYVWSRDEVKQALEPDDVRLVAQHFGMDREANFEHGYVFEVVRPASELAGDFKLSPREVNERLDTIKAKLLAVREKRDPLLRDDKVLTSWNGLMIRALAHGATALNRPEYLHAAEKAATFILSRMRDENGRLLRTYRAQLAKVPAYLDDYSFLIEGLLALHEASGDEKWLNAAIRLQDQQKLLFWDEKLHGFYFMATDHEELLVRLKDMHDSVLPSGNSVSIRNLVRLAKLTKKTEYLQEAEQTLAACVTVLQDSPRGAVNLAVALTEYLQQAPAAEPDKTSPKQSRLIEPGPGTIQLVSGEAPPAGAPPAKKKKPEYVKGQALLSVDRLLPGKQVEFVVLLDIQEGWHINTNPPPDEFAIETELTLKSKLKSKVEELSYPEGEEHEVEGLKKKVKYYTGQIEIRGLVDVPVAAAGMEEELEFRIRYQACNKSTCLPPTTLSFKVPVAVAKQGEKVRLINKKHFESQ